MTAPLSVGVSGVGPPSAARSSASVASARTGPVSNARALRGDELPDLRQELAELGHDPSRSFSAKIASIGPGSTSFSSAR